MTTVKPWESPSIDAKLAKQLIVSQFDQLDCSELTLLGEGWDNVSFCTHDGVVFRFPKREFSVALLLNEINLLPYVQQQVSLPIPVPIYTGSPTDEYPWPFAGYKLLLGETADRCALNRVERKIYTSRIAKFLAELHHIKPAEFAARGASRDLLGRLDVDLRLTKTLGYFDKIDELKLFDTILLRSYMINFNFSKPLEFNCVVHGDLYARHLLIDAQNKLSGIIDWGDTHIGNAAVDLALIHSFLPPESHAEFRAAYGSIEDAIWELAKFRAIYSSATITVYGHDINDQKLMAEGLQGLSFINETLV